MEKDFGSWFHHQHSDRQSPNLTSLGYPFNFGQQSTVPPYTNLCSNTVSGNGTLPVFAFSAQPHSKASELNEPRGWSYCFPRFCQTFAPVLNSAPKENLPANFYDNCKVTGAPDARSGCPQKRFLVFDQSGDQTTLIFSSATGTPLAQYLNSWNLKSPGAYEYNKEVPSTTRDATNSYGAFLTNEYDEEDQRDDVGTDEMHEDTEELDALLYSDDEYADSDDDEETSTGHSPSALIAYDKQEQFDESREEVASSAGPVKRQKLLDGAYDVLSSVMDTASSVKNNRCFDNDDDAESSCGDRKLGSLSGNKRSKKEKIREIVSILESIIPGGKGKDPVYVIDEAINYLRALKLKAKALGLDTP